MDEKINENIKHWIKAGWLKCRLASGELCDRHIPTRLKEKILHNNDWTNYDLWSGAEHSPIRI